MLLALTSELSFGKKVNLCFKVTEVIVTFETMPKQEVDRFIKWAAKKMELLDSILTKPTCAQEHVKLQFIRAFCQETIERF